MPLSNSTTANALYVRKAVWLLLGVALNTLELFLPRIAPLPWLKPGLANSITMIWIIKFGAVDALVYTLIRVWISSYFFGFSLVTMGLALSGGLLSTAAMGLAWNTLGKNGQLGTIGLGITGAIMHNAGQLAAVYLLLTRNGAIFYQLPLMGVAALLFGGFIGAVTPVLWRILVMDTPIQRQHYDHYSTDIQRSPGPLQSTAILLILAGSVSLVAVNNHLILFGIAAAVSLVVFFTGDKSVSTLAYPLRFWIMFLFVGLIYLSFSYGKRIPFVPFVTYEGAAAAAAQFLRLWTWLEAGLLLHRLHCNGLVFILLRRLFPNHGETLMAGLVSLEYFPAVLSYVKGKEARNEISWRRPFQAIETFLGRVQNHILMLIDEYDEKRSGRQDERR